MIKPILLALSLCPLILDVYGQTKTKNTEVQLNVANFSMPGLMSAINPKLGVTISWQLNNHFSVDLGYHQWMLRGEYVFDLKNPYTAWPGQLYSRSDYKNLDLSLKYNAFLKKHKFYGGAGVSYASGLSTYVDKVSKGTFDLIMHTTPFSKQNHAGVNFTAGYGFSITRRVSLGISGKARVLSKNYEEYDLTLNVGYMFNAFKRIKNESVKKELN